MMLYLGVLDRTPRYKKLRKDRDLELKKSVSYGHVSPLS